jgi:hypothetical protein
MRIILTLFRRTDRAVLAVNGFAADGNMFVKKVKQRLEVHSRSCPFVHQIHLTTVLLLSQWYKHAHGKDMPLRAIARLIQTMLYARRFFPYYVYNILGGIEDDGEYAARCPCPSVLPLCPLCLPSFDIRHPTRPSVTIISVRSNARTLTDAIRRHWRRLLLRSRWILRTGGVPRRWRRTVTSAAIPRQPGQCPRTFVVREPQLTSSLPFFPIYVLLLAFATCLLASHTASHPTRSCSLNAHIGFFLASRTLRNALNGRRRGASPGGTPMSTRSGPPPRLAILIHRLRCSPSHA